MQIKQFKIRCSAIGQIMTNAKGSITAKQIEKIELLRIKEKRTEKQQQELNDLEEKSKQIILSDTCKTYCKNWLKIEAFKRTKEISTKQMEKGTKQEDEAIEMLINANLISPFASKNEEFFEDDFMQGTPDLVLPDDIDDIKCSWDLFTFPLFESENKNKIYEDQLQGYMHLTGKKKARLRYNLVNTPTELVEKEIYYAIKDKDLNAKEIEEITKQIERNHSYEDIDVKHRIKTFEFEYNTKRIEAIQKRVLECRVYIDELIKEYL